MADLTSIGFTVLAGLIVFFLTMMAFGCAVRKRHIGIAPRCTARPKNTIYNPNGRDCQDRGNPTWGWIKWTMSLSFDTMLRGIPGTGTRNGGLDGALLRVNLDSIILIKFHDLCMRVCALTTFLSLLIILPLNWTATNPNPIDLTDYEKTTLANIPPVTKDNNGNNLLFRLYLIVICAWIVNYYALHLIELEWKENLGLRRAFYLESDHYLNRKKELETTVGSMTSYEDDDVSSTMRSNEINRAFHRDPWIPHPEQRDTVPNIELYSVLVHNLPGLPSEVMDKDNQEDFVGFTRKQSMDWQLCVATAFFDHIVPNQPGFSSSVAALTILPTATQLARAWRKWYTAAGKLRRLRFIRTIIASRRHYDIESTTGDDEIASAVSSSAASSSTGSWMGPLTQNVTTPPGNYLDDMSGSPTSKDDDEFRRYCREVFGAKDNAEVEHQFFKALDYGPEQTAMYTRELAQGAAACCPHGCNEERLYHADFQELLELEKEAVEDVHEANLDLLDAQKRAIAEESGSDENNGVLYDGNNLEFKNRQQKLYMQHKRVEGEIELGHSSTISEIDDLEEILPEKLQVESELYKKSPLVTSDRQRSESSADSAPSKKSNESSTTSRYSSAPIGRKTKAKTVMTDIMQTLTESPSSLLFEERDPTPPIKNHKPFMPRYPTQNPNTPTQQRFHSLTPGLSMKSPQQQDYLTRSNSMKPSFNFTPQRNYSITLNYGGKFVFRDEDDMQRSVASGVTTGTNAGDRSTVATAMNALDDESVHSFRSLFPITSQQNQNVPTVARRRLNSNNSSSSRAAEGVSDQWLHYERIRENDERSYNSKNTVKNVDDIKKDYDKAEKPFSGAYKNFKIPDIPKIPHPRELFEKGKDYVQDFFGMKTAVNRLARENTIAVVTFTSRQAAVAARHCLADGRGAYRWVADRNVPVPPLADAASCDLKTCRGCCRPVTASINKRQKMVRKYVSMVALIFLFIFYIVPINIATSFFNEQRLTQLIPSLKEIQKNFLFNNSISGLIQGLLLTLFFSVAPQLFKMIANFGSNAHSVITAEREAMSYYWWFMVITAFSGNSVLTAVLDMFNELFFDDSFKKLITTIGDSVPRKVSATWINWLILRTTMILPLQYLLQVNTFIFYFFGWKCCARCVMGGGPGGQTPYRIYIDSGVVFMCNVALSFAAPLISPFALVYFMFCIPLWRRNSIYLYRPKYDGGGIRWPFLADELISSLIVGQILLITMMFLREATGPAFMAFIPLIPTIFSRKIYRSRYLKAYNDAGLLQTSLLDEWDNGVPSSMEKREDLRRFLVDAHKAAYIPVCIASQTTSSLTAQPAVVIPKDGDVEPPPATAGGGGGEDSSILEGGGGAGTGTGTGTGTGDLSFNQSYTPFRPSLDQQVGASMRRITFANYDYEKNWGISEV